MSPKPNCQARREQAARDIAERLAESVRGFRYRQEEDAWLLVGGVWHPDWQKIGDSWCRCFTIDRNGDVVDF